MPNKSTSPSSIAFIDKLYDDSLVARRLIRMVADCAENACNAESGGQQAFITYESLYGTLNHAIEILESVDDRTQLLWKEVVKTSKRSSSADDKVLSLTPFDCKVN